MVMRGTTSYMAVLGNDVINGGADNDRLFGLNGNDTIDGGAGDDAIYGDNLLTVVGDRRSSNDRPNQAVPNLVYDYI